MLKKGAIILGMLCISYVHLAQPQSANKYFDNTLNVIINDIYLQHFFLKLDTVLLKKQGKVSIVHFGDSHIQADFFSGQVRKQLQNTFGNAGRGFVFPYQIANSNGPTDIGIKFTGQWTSSSIMNGYEYVSIGASGYSVRAKDSSFVSLYPIRNASFNYSFNKLTIFQSEGYFEPQGNLHDVRASAIGGSNTLPFTSYVFKNFQDSINLMAKTTKNRSVELFGMVLENSNAGVLYHAMGANGASTVQYLRSDKFDKQIAALNADLVIVSLGTNDAYLPTSRFCSSCAKDRFRTIIYKIRKQCPNAAIILTTPADHYYRRRYDNRNLYYLNKALLKLADEENVAIWDLYGIMGGERSITKWQKGGLARGDLIHFTKEGYTLQGTLLYEAILESYEKRFN